MSQPYVPPAPPGPHGAPQFRPPGYPPAPSPYGSPPAPTPYPASYPAPYTAQHPAPAIPRPMPRPAVVTLAATMALTSEEYVALETTGLVAFFGRHREEYVTLARRAYAYARSYLDEQGLEVRVDDVSQALEPALRVRADLRDYLAEHRLTQQYWYRRVSDLVLDKAWSELVKSDG